MNHKRSAYLGIILIMVSGQFCLQAWNQSKKILEAFLIHINVITGVYIYIFFLGGIDVYYTLKAIILHCKRLNTFLTTSLTILEALLDTCFQVAVVSVQKGSLR